MRRRSASLNCVRRRRPCRSPRESASAEARVLAGDEQITAEGEVVAHESARSRHEPQRQRFVERVADADTQGDAVAQARREIEGGKSLASLRESPKRAFSIWKPASWSEPVTRSVTSACGTGNQVFVAGGVLTVRSSSSVTSRAPACSRDETSHDCYLLMMRRIGMQAPTWNLRRDRRRKQSR